MTGPDKGGIAAWIFTALAIWRAGGRPVRIRPKRPRERVPLNGLIIGGGADVAPELYGETVADLVRMTDEEVERGRTPWRSLILFPFVYLVRRLFTASTTEASDPARDDLERRLILDALARQMPVLGICRGAQLLNVCAGGTLAQDLSDFYVETPQIRTVLPKKKIILDESHLRRLLGRDETRVNSLHDQAVGELGDGLRAVARERSGVIQAIEHPERDFVVGVQWHPEYMPHHRSQQAIFAGLVDAARADHVDPAGVEHGP